MVAAINICTCDRDGRRLSSTPAHFEAPDALGSGERGGRILMPAEFQFHALYIYEHEATQKSISENNKGAPKIGKLDTWGSGVCDTHKVSVVKLFISVTSG